MEYIPKFNILNKHEEFANGTYIANIIVNGNLAKTKKFIVLK